MINQVGDRTRLPVLIGDEDIDICTKPWSGSLHIYLRNMLVEDKKSAGR
jgi:hypothetical protein